ncbi:hypothetical protein F5Y18DRAFT_175702 [Xylariaceae sp. FL1019]|nr:hypothetical protein F5Y18DRAFT_175702 [Xylariaceae sp. FL1019]
MPFVSFHWETALLLLLSPQPLLSQHLRNPNLASLDAELTYLLPIPFTGNLTSDFVGSTNVVNETVSGALYAAEKAPFVSYSDEFEDLVGNASIVVANHGMSLSGPVAYEAGIWLPDHDEVWFTSSIRGGPTEIYIYSLENDTVFQPELKAAKGWEEYVPVPNPNGGYYFDGAVYFGVFGDETRPAGVVAVDPITYVVRPVVNSWFGLGFNSVDDVVVTYTGGRSRIYFSDVDLAVFGVDIGRPGPYLPNAIWMFTPSTKTLQPVIPRSDVLIPNGVATDKDFKHLFVTDTSETATQGAGAQNNVTSSPAIYRYDISPHDGLVSNKVLLGFARQGYADGIKVDDKGRIWTAEYEGIMVRNAQGKELGFFNRNYILSGTEYPTVQLASFALAGDTLVVLGIDKIYTIKLAECVMHPDRYSK